uniref:BED-type domain-containing protein n=2 Tax=Caenorhabditis japonica TaxID=281687 RepID=A0A8R1E314_CAEJA
MTRRKQDCTLVMEPLRTPIKSEDDSAFFDGTNTDELDTSQIMAALLEQHAASAAGASGAPKEIKISSHHASELLMAAGLRPHKKTSEIWEHYKCLNEKQNVECIYCWKVLKRNDSSTKSMWGHMNAYHQDVLSDGTTRKKVKRPAASAGAGGLDGDETPTQPYVKRVRGGSSANHSAMPSMVKMEQKPMLDSMAFLQQLQQSGSLTDADFAAFGAGGSLNFLDSLPKSSEVININSGFVKMEEPDADEAENQNQNQNQNQNHVEAASSSSSDEPARHAESPESHHSSAQDQNDQLAAFVSSLTQSNPMMFAMLNAAGSPPTSTPATSSTLPPATLPPVPPNAPVSPSGAMSPSRDPSSFSLSEGHCAAQLMSMALDLEMTMSYHRRRVDIELCFESNRTAEKSGGRGKVICLTDLGKEIKKLSRNECLTIQEKVTERKPAKIVPLVAKSVDWSVASSSRVKRYV